MFTNQAITEISALMTADVPVFLWGAPGIGKSDLVRQIASGKPLVDFRASLLDPVDLRGVPSVTDGKTKWNAPDFLPDVARHGEEGILFMDELNVAPVSVQAALYQLVLDRRLGEYQLPNSWRIVAAGNRQSDRAAAQRMPSALANRFAHIDIEPDVAAWADWALSAGIAPEIIAFVRFRPALLHSMDTPDLRAFPTPRAWARLSAAMKTGMGNVAHLAEAIIGQGAAAEFVGYLKIYNDLPSLDHIVAKPEKAKVPSDPGTLFAITSALSRRAAAEPAKFPAIVTYLGRCPPEFAAFGVLDSIKLEPGLKETKPFVDWAIANAAVVS